MPTEIIYYKCTLCGKPISKKEHETDAGFCKECNDLTINKEDGIIDA